MKVFRLFRLEHGFFGVFVVWTQYVDVQHLVYWQGQHVFVMPCYALEQAVEEPSPPKGTIAHPTTFTTFRVELGLFQVLEPCQIGRSRL
jgi:hypothetical protein